MQFLHKKLKKKISETGFISWCTKDLSKIRRKAIHREWILTNI